MIMKKNGTFEIGDEVRGKISGESAFVTKIINAKRIDVIYFNRKENSNVPAEDFKLIRDCRDIRAGDWARDIIDSEVVKIKKVENQYLYWNKSNFMTLVSWRRATPLQVKQAGFKWDDKSESDIKPKQVEPKPTPKIKRPKKVRTINIFWDNVDYQKEKIDGVDILTVKSKFEELILKRKHLNKLILEGRKLLNRHKKMVDNKEFE